MKQRIASVQRSAGWISSDSANASTSLEKAGEMKNRYDRRI